MGDFNGSAEGEENFRFERRIRERRGQEKAGGLRQRRETRWVGLRPALPSASGDREQSNKIFDKILLSTLSLGPALCAGPNPRAAGCADLSPTVSGL